MARLKGLDTTVELTRYAQALHEVHGFDFALRYYSHNAAKNLSLGEARALSAAGLQIGVVWETSGTHPGFFTLAQGVADGSAAHRMAFDAIGQPSGSAIYFAVDYDASQADLDGPVSNYFTGVHAGLFAAGGGQQLYQVGVYGSGLCCATLRERGAAAFSWLSQSTGFAGSESYARTLQYELIQYLPQRLVIDGVTLLVDPDATHPDRPAGLFRV
jgi:hypothetical protein